jgi:zinc protease
VNVRILSIALCLTLVLPPAAPAAVPATKPDSVVDTVLTNGLHVIIAPDRLAPVVVTYIRYDAGSDEGTLSGQAHAVEHMMFRGTSDVSASQFNDIVARTGGVYNASTSNEATDYYFIVPSRFLGVVLHLEADRMRKASFKESDWSTERGAIEQEVRAHESSPTFSFTQQMRDALYGNTPYARDALGTVTSFDAMNAGELRAFYNEWYHPNNATLVVAGDVDPASALAIVKAQFGPIPQKPLPARPKISLPPLPATPVVASAYLAAGATGFTVRFPDIASPDYAASRIAISVLDDPRGKLADLNASGKLQGAAASSSTSSDASFATVQASLKQGEDPAKVASLLDETIARILKDGVPADAVAAAKRSISASQAYQLTSIPNVASAWASASSLGLKSPNALLARFEAVTPADVNRVLHKYFSADRLAFTLTPSKQAPKRTIDLGGGEHVAYTGREHQPLPAWAAAAFRKPLTPPRIADAHFYDLPNGLRLVVSDVKIAPVVVLSGYVKSNELLHAPTDKQGVAEATGAMMSWGSTTLDRKAFAAALQAIPASVRVGVYFDLQSRAKDFDRALALLAQEMLHPALPESTLALIKKNSVPVLSEQQKRAPWLALLATDAALYPAGDPFHNHMTAESLQNVSMTDVHAWYAKTFRPDLTTIAVVGDLKPAYVRAEIAKYFGNWRAHGAKPTFIYPHLKLNGPVQASFPSPTAAQQSVTMTELLGLVETNPEAPALQLADTMLTGEGMASILTHDLRTKHGYVYYVGSSLNVGKQRSTYTFDFSADPKNAKAATDALLADLRNLQTTLVSADDLARAKTTILARSALSLDNFGGLASALRDAASAPKSTLTTTNSQNENAWARLLDVTPTELRAAFAKWVRVNDFAHISVVPASPSPSPVPSPSPIVTASPRAATP